MEEPVEVFKVEIVAPVEQRSGELCKNSVERIRKVRALALTNFVWRALLY